MLFYKPNVKVMCSSAGTYVIKYYREDESIIQLPHPPGPITVSIKRKYDESRGLSSTHSLTHLVSMLEQKDYDKEHSTALL